jgi:hypothetical protein
MGLKNPILKTRFKNPDINRFKILDSRTRIQISGYKKTGLKTRI